MPIASGDRHISLDVLRAIALFFVFLINMEYFARPLEAHGLGLEPGLEGIDYVIAWCEYVFVERKAWCLFALLFGMGFAVMSDRAQDMGRGFVIPYLRRSVALLVIGAMHVALLWAGDVLHTYAIAAISLLVILLGRPWWLLIPVPMFIVAFVTWGGRGYLGGIIGFLLFSLAAAWIRSGGNDRLWKAGVLLYLSPSIVITLMTMPALLSTPSPQIIAERAKRLAEMRSAADHAADVNQLGSYVDNIFLRIGDVGQSLPDETRSVVAAVGLFLIGAWFVRAGIVRNLSEHRHILVRNALIGLPLGAVLALASAFMATGPSAMHAPIWTLAAQLMSAAALLTSVGAASSVMWLCDRWRGLAFLAPAGRMALTNYLCQSSLCTLLFYGYGFGLENVARITQLIMVIAIFMCQLIISTLWLRNFQFGPVEWLWRIATYLRIPRMRRTLALEAPVSAASAGRGWH
jgi:uncharacterized protein